MNLVLLILLILILVGGLPTWGYHHYGYAPSGAWPSASHSNSMAACPS